MTWLRFRRGIPPALWWGMALLTLALLPTLAGPALVTAKSAEIFGGIPNLPPSWEHPLGTQSQGRDILASLMLGIPSTVLIGVLGGGIATLIGATLGFASGFLGGRTDATIRTIVDVGMTIPPLAVLILISASFQSISVPVMGLIIATTAWMSSTRVVRSQVLSLREREFIRVARLSGLGSFRIMLLELAPNLIPFLAAVLVNAIITAMIASIGLEVLGLGPPQAFTLGNLIYEAIFYTAMWRGMWWWWAPPLIILIFIFIGLFLVSSALDQIANPRLGRGQ
jgi:peptide/nickel transport system permease protein